MNIGITGCNGWIGSQVFSFLKSKNFKLINLDKFTRQYSKFKTIKKTPKMSFILHFASKTSIERSFINPFETYFNNVLNTLVALQLAYKSKATLVIISSYVYGKPEKMPINEQHPTKTTNPYMSSKLISDKISYEISKSLKIKTIILRPFNIYGPGLKHGMLISDLINQGLKKKNLILKDPKSSRDYVYIKDFNFLFHKILKKKVEKNNIYNIGSGKSYSNLYIAKEISKYFKKSKLVILKKPRNNEVKKVVSSCKKVHNDYKWKVKYSINQGIKDIIENNKK